MLNVLPAGSPPTTVSVLCRDLPDVDVTMLLAVELDKSLVEGVGGEVRGERGASVGVAFFGEGDEVLFVTLESFLLTIVVSSVVVVVAVVVEPG